MTTTEFTSLFQRDIKKVIDEILQFRQEENIWSVSGTISNSAGNLVLHLVGGLNYLIGGVLANTGYTRNRAAEFETKNVQKSLLISQLERLGSMVEISIQGLTAQQLEQPFPIFFD
jgi:Protein of unknown function (DUF1572)